MRSSPRAVDAESPPKRTIKESAIIPSRCSFMSPLYIDPGEGTFVIDRRLCSGLKAGLFRAFVLQSGSARWGFSLAPAYAHDLNRMGDSPGRWA